MMIASHARHDRRVGTLHDRAADIVLVGGRVWTLDAARPWESAVAVAAGRIVAVGTDRDVGELTGPATRRIDLRGGLLIPGFQDAHVHPVAAGLAAERCALNDLRTKADYLEAIARYAADHPEREWIEGGGWSLDAFPGGTPDRASLDAVVPERPAYLENRDGHDAWVNSRALELARITRDTPDPPDGRIERLPGGDPQGALHEGARGLVNRLLPSPTVAELERALARAQAQLHSLGITAWQDAHVSPATLEAYRNVANRGLLTAHVVAALGWDTHRGREQVDELIELRRRGTSGRIQATSVKIFQDGVMENFSAAMLDPYLGPDGLPTANRGTSLTEAQELARVVVRLDAEGFQVHIHAIGDRAVRESLDAFEQARAMNGHRDARHHIAHIQVIHPADIPRFAALGVVANMQPYWACAEPQITELTNPFLGAGRAGRQYPFASLHRAGAILAGGSDWSVSTPDPLRQIEVAVTRVDDERRDADPFLPDERLDLATALAAFTRGSAYVNHLERETGSIEVGKLADLAVIDRDLFARDAGPIGDARVLLTLIDGRPVFEDPALEG
jgi:predicted amidohydrolase YtcJ